MSTDVAGVSARRRLRLRKLAAGRKQELVIGAVPYSILAVLVGLYGYLQPESLSGEQLVLTMNLALVLMLAGVGQTFVLLSGGIDLSVAGVMSVANTIAAVYMTTSERTVWISLLIIALGWIPGAINGLLIVVFDLQPFIVTLGTWFVWAGVAFYVLPTAGDAFVHERYASLTNGSLLGIDNTLWIVLAIALLGMWFLRTRVGLEIRAVGADLGSARLAGIRTNLAIVVAYSICSLCATLGGLVLASQSLSGDPSVGDKYLLSSVAAAVIGGTSLFGGSATVVGTLVGALVLGYIGRVTFALELPSEWALIFSGLLLMLAVALHGLVRAFVGRRR
jgi:ribose transport system permease protein